MCPVDGCARKIQSKGYCHKHYLRIKRHGDAGIVLLTRHGLTGKPTHNSWFSMKQRCTNPNATGYSHYGGRDIKICDRWLDNVTGFVNFLEDMGERPPNTTLDRINNELGYYPENCRWASKKTQSLNRRKSKYTGITWNRHREKWISRITRNGTTLNLGSFDNRDEALKIRTERLKDVSNISRL